MGVCRKGVGERAKVEGKYKMEKSQPVTPLIKHCRNCFYLEHLVDCSHKCFTHLISSNSLVRQIPSDFEDEETDPKKLPEVILYC